MGHTCLCLACSQNWPLLSFMKEELRLDPEDSRMNRFLGIKCLHCEQTIKRKTTNEPFLALRTCVVCGENTNLLEDIPLGLIKAVSKEVGIFVNF